MLGLMIRPPGRTGPSRLQSGAWILFVALLSVPVLLASPEAAPTVDPVPSPLEMIVSGTPPISVELPDPALRGVRHTVRIVGQPGSGLAGSAVSILDAAGDALAAGTLAADGTLSVVLRIPAEGALRVEVAPFPDPVFATPRRIPGLLSLVPPILAILIALIFRQVVPALFSGIWVGAWIVHGDPLAGLLRTIDRYVVQSLTNGDHASILVFSLMLGGMVGIVSRGGGMLGLVRSLTPYATSGRRGQLVTWLLGVVVFFDDYANTLLVGNTMRPVTDKLRASRARSWPTSSIRPPPRSPASRWSRPGSATRCR